MSMASLVLGIVGLASGALTFVPVLNWFSWVGFPASVLAIIFGAVALSKAKKAGIKDSKAKTGLILGIVAIALGILAVIVAASIIACAATTFLR